jgi:penicillin-binding protein 1A
VQGASTLTMQLARNLFLSPDRSFHRKVQETMLAIQIERRFTKPQIFTLYANQIFLGHGVYGFEAASEFYFSKPARNLTLTEAALLAGLPKGPGVYSPINHPDRAMKRRNLVINAMLEDGKITALPRPPMPVRRPWFCICSTILTRWRLISSKKSAATLKTNTAPTRFTKAD